MKGVQDVIEPIGQIAYADGSIYGLIGEVTILLEEKGLKDKSEEFVGRAVRLTTYNEVLDLSRDYVQFHHGENDEPATN